MSEAVFSFTGRNGKNYEIVLAKEAEIDIYLVERAKNIYRLGKSLFASGVSQDKVVSDALQLNSEFLSLLASEFSKIEPRFFTVEDGSLDDFALITDKGIDKFARFINMTVENFFIKSMALSSLIVGGEKVDESAIRDLLETQRANTSSDAETSSSEDKAEDTGSVPEQSPA